MSGPATASGDGLAACVRRALDEVHDPCSVAAGRTMGLDEMGLVERIDVDRDGNVAVRIRLTSPSCMMVGFFLDAIGREVGALEGVASVDVSFDDGLDWTSDLIRAGSRGVRSMG